MKKSTYLSAKADYREVRKKSSSLFLITYLICVLSFSFLWAVGYQIVEIIIHSEIKLPSYSKGSIIKFLYPLIKLNLWRIPLGILIVIIFTKSHDASYPIDPKGINKEKLSGKIADKNSTNVDEVAAL